MTDEDPGELDRLRALVYAEAEASAGMQEQEGPGGFFMPRTALACTPPSGFSTPFGTPAQSGPPVAAKRALTSLEDVRESFQRRLGAGVVGETLEQPRESPASLEDVTGTGLSGLSTEDLADMATSATGGIMEAVRARNSKLNKDELAAIGQHVDAVGSVVTHLLVRLAGAEKRAAEAELRSARKMIAGREPTVAVTSAGQPRSYAAAIKLGKHMEPVPIPVRLGPAVAVFPAPDQKDKIRTAEDTKKVLQVAVNLAGLGIKVQGLRKTGGAGIIVQTASTKEAQTFRAALPPTLQSGGPKERHPMISLVGVDGELKPEDIVARLHDQNLNEVGIGLEAVRAKFKPLFNRSRRSNRKTWICQCAPDLRARLIERGKVYIGWDVVEVVDFIGVTCCRRCQMYGHPEKYCRAKGMTCGKCGEDGHKNECQKAESCCATCKKLNRRDRAHRTNSQECPARKHAEQRSIATTNYGS